MAKILVIDDDPDIIKIFEMVLRDHGHYVNSANTGEEGISKINADLPDLIILDIQMPGKGGLTVANELAKKKLSIPFILCTGTVLDDPVEAFELFVVRHLYVGTLKKPMELEDISKIVENGLLLGQELKKQS